MILDALQPSMVPITAMPKAPPAADAGFAAQLQALQDREETARTAAEQLVAQTLVLPVLSSMREGPFLEGPFKPGNAERRFAPLLDQHMADSITTSSRFTLVDSVVDRLLSQGSPTQVEVLA
ncbi:MAG: rod-binding protein [Phycisphaerales bacterium]|nr:rod-binding protein [Phycisphaerales bacterium]